MEKKTVSNYEKLQKVKGSFVQSNWVDETKIELDQKWRETSQMISLKILRTLRKRNLKQVDLAESLQVSQQVVSKWLKGSENFTLETINKLETALGVKLIEVPTAEEIQTPTLSTFFRKEKETLIYNNLSLGDIDIFINSRNKLHIKERYGKHTI